MAGQSVLFKPALDFKPGYRTRWGQLYGCSYGLSLINAAVHHKRLFVVITPDTPTASRLNYELKFFNNDEDALPVMQFPDWETLPYDAFSPHQDIISDRLSTLYHLPDMQRGILLVPLSTLIQRISPRAFLDANCLIINVGDKLDIEAMRIRLTSAGYRAVSQVMEHGEFAVRGSIIDLLPSGSRIPYRIELFDDDIESIRTFDPDTQRSADKIDSVRLLPAREFPLTEQAITQFRQNFRATFEGDPNASQLYRDVSDAITPPGIEYYLPLFFDQTATLFDFIPDNAVVCLVDDAHKQIEQLWQDIEYRYEQRRYDRQRPPMPPNNLFLRENEFFQAINRFPQLQIQSFKFDDDARDINFQTESPPQLAIDARATQPADKLIQFVSDFDGRILFVAESTGRRETLLEIFRHQQLHTETVDNWQAFLACGKPLCITVAPLDRGLLLKQFGIAIITEPQLFGEHVVQQRRRRAKQRDPDLVIKNLVELQEGTPVVHEDHGVGRYVGLQRLNVGGIEQEFLTLVYADNDKLYVPVASLHLISRYTGASVESAPLHKLGSAQWEKAKRKAREKVRDVAAELLDIYAKREAQQGHIYSIDDEHYNLFSSAFPFEETPDQHDAIAGVIKDLRSTKPMDRLICGDVGFGKTEVAMRAAFVAVQDGKQVAMLVPTTLLAQQHYENFKDRFADWPVRIESISRFKSKKEQDTVKQDLSDGKVDIIIGTHKLIQGDIQFKRLGIVIIDEEHRFGVRQKEKFKALRSQVDLLTLTATPIPRTLNMSLSGIRDLSIIATAPAKRLSIKTFVSEWNDATIKEACLREIRRGGQIFALHNEVKTIDKAAAKFQQLLPDAAVRIAHGQMRERELEHVMSDFYHQRFNILVCTTIIETGIDVPNANTIIIERADHFGLAQLYQLRGRVGRSHHQAYAYLLVPPKNQMTADAVKRLEAIESMEELGTGFTLATHDLEIRGAGEMLGDEQSGHMHEIGFSLYMELLERAVNALKSGKHPDLDRPLDHGTEIDLGISALIPDDYLPDVHARLIMYKRIANAKTEDDLRELQVEMIDRFGLLPQAVKNLFTVTQLKLKATPLGIKKIEFGREGGRLLFNEQPNIEPLKIIQLIQTKPSVYKLDGPDKLRVVQPMEQAEQRSNFVGELLVKLH